MDRSRERSAMVERQLADRGIRDRRLLDAFRAVPRELFVGPQHQDLAYEDGPLPIGEGQTISQPYVVALMIEAAAVGPDDRVLDVGAGSGYSTALLSRLAREVYAIERLPGLAATARERLERLGCANVELVAGDGTRGLPQAAPFDAILVAAGIDRVPPALEQQLAAGGRLVIPVGPTGGPQELVRLTRRGPDDFARESLGGVAFVPLLADPPGGTPRGSA